jgi:hypothetical protein
MTSSSRSCRRAGISSSGCMTDILTSGQGHLTQVKCPEKRGKLKVAGIGIPAQSTSGLSHSPRGRTSFIVQSAYSLVLALMFPKRPFREVPVP